MSAKPLRLVLVEDSTTQRAHLKQLLEADEDIVVIAEAADGDAGVAAVAAHRPDVVTMDLDMPGSGGIGAVARIMAEHPTPILIISGVIDGADAAPAVAALAAGAVDALPKPGHWSIETERALRQLVRTVASVPVVGRRRGARAQRARRSRRAPAPVVGVAASTGGPAALAAFLQALPLLPAPVLVVQHIHPWFIEGFVSWLDSAVALPVHAAADATLPAPGSVYIAPGEVHLRVARSGHMLLRPDPPAMHRPSADELLSSIAANVGAAAVGVVLTGMGDDGAAGLLAMRRAGARTFAQDEESCVVFGMPRAADRLGAAQRLLAPDKLAAAVAAAVHELG